MEGRQGPGQEEGGQEEGREEEGREEVISWYKRRKRVEGVDEKQLAVAMAALARNEHFRTVVEHLHERRERYVRGLQVETVVKCANRHFMESGKLEAVDELLDDLELWTKAKLDDDSI